MKLVHNWSAVLRRAYSVRLMIVAAIMSGLEVVLPLIGDRLPIPTGVFAALSFIVVAAAFVARLIAQQGVDEDH